MEKPKKIKKLTAGKTISSIMVAAAILIFGLGYYFYVKPASDLTTELSGQDILTLQVKLGEREIRLINVKKAIQSYVNPSDETIIKLNEALPSEPGEIDLFVNLTSLIEQSGLRVESIKISVSTEKEIPLALQALGTAPVSKVKEVNINVSVDGMSYTNLKRFIRNIESNSRLLRLNDLTFNPTSSSYNTVLTAYYLEN